MTKSNCKSFKLTETVLTESLSSDAVDRANGVIRGVKVLGRISKNGREYSDSAMEDAKRLYEGLTVNVNHPDRKTPKIERGFLEGFGELRNCEKKNDGVYADLHFLKSHPAAEPVCESAERFPKSFGLSHNAEGELTKRSGKLVVESLTSAVSVDIVRRPATNEGLFESVDEDQPMKKVSVTIKGLIESAKSKAKRYTQANLAKLIEMEGGDSAMMGAPVDIMAPEEEAEPDPDAQIEEAFKSMVVAVLDDTSLDAQGKIDRITEILTAQDSLLSGKPAESKPTEGDKAVAESEAIKKLQDGQTSLMESLDKLNKRMERDDLKSLLESSKREATAERIDLLASTAADKRKALIESWPEAQAKPNGVVKPRSGSILESADATEKYPADSKSFARSF